MPSQAPDRPTERAAERILDQADKAAGHGETSSTCQNCVYTSDMHTLLLIAIV